MLPDPTSDPATSVGLASEEFHLYLFPAHPRKKKGGGGLLNSLIAQKQKSNDSLEGLQAPLEN